MIISKPARTNDYSSSTYLYTCGRSDDCGVTTRRLRVGSPSIRWLWSRLWRELAAVGYETTGHTLTACAVSEQQFTWAKNGGITYAHRSEVIRTPPPREDGSKLCYFDSLAPAGMVGSVSYNPNIKSCIQATVTEDTNQSL
jgi:hypothetical protein